MKKDDFEISDHAIAFLERMVSNAGAFGAYALAMATVLCAQSGLELSEELAERVARAGQKYDFIGRNFIDEIAGITEEWIRQKNTERLAAVKTVREVRGTKR